MAPPTAIRPPGEGMLEQPCPTFAPVPPMELAEPGRPAKITREFGAAYGANNTYQRKYDWPWLCRYQADNAAIARGPAPKVVFMGDSITENWGRYDPAFFTNGVVDRGISGQTSPQMLLRFHQDVVALHPRVVHIMAGSNDIAGNTGPTSPEAFKNNIRAMVEIAQANRIAVVLASIPPSNRFSLYPKIKPAPRIAELNTWLKAYAAERGAVYADYFSVLVGPDAGMQPAYTSDGLHPATDGYRTMRPVAERAIAEAERQGPRPKR
jgi:lysophospholipase L1-like esterase